jgi:osmoprotectant transport system substrate-binding protein
VPGPRTIRPRTSGLTVVLGVLALGIAAAACSPAPAPATPRPPPSPAITIGAPDTTAQLIVATLYAEVLRHAGATVTLRTGLGTRASVEPALASGRLDLYPDAAGSLLLYLDSNDTAAATETATALPELRRILGAARATVLRPAPALDGEVFVVTRDSAQQNHLTTLSSLAPAASTLILGGPPTCATDPQCEAGLQRTYGLHFKSFTSLDDNVVPVIRTAVDTPAVAAALDALSAQLTTDQLGQLALEVTVDHGSPGTVARRWLVHVHLI